MWDTDSYQNLWVCRQLIYILFNTSVLKSMREQFGRTGKGLVSEVVEAYFKVQGFSLTWQLSFVTSCYYSTVHVDDQVNVLQ